METGNRAGFEPEFHNLTDADFQHTFNVGSFAIGKETMKLADLHEALKQTYCGSIGAEYMHITNTEEKRWIQQHIESVVGQPSFTAQEKKRFLRELTAAEGIERYLGAQIPRRQAFFPRRGRRADSDAQGNDPLCRNQRHP